MNHDDTGSAVTSGSTLTRRFPLATAGLIVVLIMPELLQAGATTTATDNEVTQERIAIGTAFETELFIRRSARSGPTALITGGIHGNEPAGAAAAAQMKTWPIIRGTLIIIARANPPALTAARRYTPGTSEPFRNLNRNFIVTDRGVQTTGLMAPVLWNVVEQFQPDWVLDLHEGFDFNRQNKKSVGSSVIADKHPDTQALADQLISGVDQEISNADRRFTKRGPPIKGSLARAAADATPARALILETTYKDQRLAVRTRQHRRMVAAALHQMNVIASADVASRIVPAQHQDQFNIALYDDGGIFGNGVPALQTLLQSQPDVTVHRICAQDIQAGVLNQFDALCCSGGSGSRQSASLGEQGRAAVRHFVKRGGDYIGICGGSYLACSGFKWGLAILDAKTKSNRWRRGRATLDVQLTPAGRHRFAAEQSSLPILYVNGPIWEPHHQPDIADYEVLAMFREEVSENNAPAGIMIHSPAAVHGTYGAGHVICFSPHPEQSDGAAFLIRQTVDFLSTAD